LQFLGALTMKVIEYEIKRLAHREIEKVEKEAEFEKNVVKIKSETSGDETKQGRLSQDELI